MSVEAAWWREAISPSDAAPSLIPEEDFPSWTAFVLKEEQRLSNSDK